MKRIIVIKADGTEYQLDKRPNLEQMQKIVGGYIEHVSVLDCVEDGRPRYTSMYVNEEGYINDLPLNERASEIYQRNIRAQYPDSAEPFKEANEEFRKQFGGALIEAFPEGYDANDPKIAGDVIFFEGYTCEEVNRLYDNE